MLGSVDIVNTEHAVVIIEDICPSKFIADWLDHIFVKGERAAEGVNCQVKMFANGAIASIMTTACSVFTMSTLPVIANGVSSVII